MYTTPKDAPLTYTFNEAADYAKQLNADRYLGHDDWRVPTNAELDVLQENREKGALRGTFKVTVTRSDPAGWYWTAREADFYDAWHQRLSSGYPEWLYESDSASLRCVR